jgi:hypothetical protein
MYTFNILNRKKKSVDVIPIFCKSNNEAHKIRSKILSARPELTSTNIIKINKVKIWPER